MSAVVARSLELVGHMCHIVTLRRDDLRRIGDIIERAEHEENVRSLVSIPEDPLIAGPPDARLCWAVCSGKTVRELVGPVSAITDISMLMHAVAHDERAVPFSGLVEDHTLPELYRLLLNWAPTVEDPGIPVTNPEDSTTRTLSLMHPFVILRVANRSCGAGASESLAPPPDASHSEPPPLNN